MRRLCILFAALCLLAVGSVACAYGKTAEDLYPQEVSLDEMERQAVVFIDEAIKKSGDTRRYKVEKASMPRILRAPEGNVSFVMSLPYGVRFWGNTAVSVDVLVAARRSAPSSASSRCVYSTAWRWQHARSWQGSR